MHIQRGGRGYTGGVFESIKVWFILKDVICHNSCSISFHPGIIVVVWPGDADQLPLDARKRELCVDVSRSVFSTTSTFLRGEDTALYRCHAPNLLIALEDISLVVLINLLTILDERRKKEEDDLCQRLRRLCTYLSCSYFF